MKKRLLTMILATTMMCSLFTACGKTTDNQKPSKDDVIVEAGDSTTETEVDETTELAEQIKAGNPNFGKKVYDEALLAEAIAAYQQYKTDNQYNGCRMFEVENSDVPGCIVKGDPGYGIEGYGVILMYHNGELKTIEGIESFSFNDRGAVCNGWDTKKGVEGNGDDYYEWIDGEWVNVMSFSFAKDETGEYNHNTYINQEVGYENDVFEVYKLGGFIKVTSDELWFNDIQSAYNYLMEKREAMIEKFKERNKKCAESYLEQLKYKDIYY